MQAQWNEGVGRRRHHNAPRATDRAPVGRELRPVPKLDGKLGDPGEVEDDGERPVMGGQGAGGRVQVDGYLPGEDAGKRRQQYLVGLIEEQRERVIDGVTRHRLSYTTGSSDG
jgi:hypothetical protein